MTQQPRTPTTEAERLDHALEAVATAQQGWLACIEARADLLAQIEKALDRIEQDAGWLHDHVPDYSPDGVATLRDICREIAKTAAAIRSAAPVEPPPTYRVIETLQSRDKPPLDVLRRSAAPVEP